MGPVLVIIFALVEHEMLNQRLAIDSHAVLARAADRLMRLDAGGMHDIERHARLIGEDDGAVGRLALDFRRTRKRVAFGAGDALGEIELLQSLNEIAVLGMHERHGAELGAALERGEHLLVVDHQRALVGHEMLEGRDAMIDHLRHVLGDLVRPIGDAHVVRIVGRGEFGALVPGLDGVHQRFAAAGNAEIDNHRRTARERRAGAAVVIVR